MSYRHPQNLVWTSREQINACFICGDHIVNEWMFYFSHNTCNECHWVLFIFFAWCQLCMCTYIRVLYISSGLSCFIVVNIKSNYVSCVTNFFNLLYLIFYHKVVFWYVFLLHRTLDFFHNAHFDFFRDLLNWCRRIAADFQIQETSTAGLVLQESLDCFAACIPNPQKRISVAQAIGAKLNVTPDRVRISLQQRGMSIDMLWIYYIRGIFICGNFRRELSS
jgi:hypothetical protein